MCFVGDISFLSPPLVCFELYFPEMSDAAVLLPFRSLPPSLPCLLLAKSSPKLLLLPGLCLVVDCKTRAEVFLGFKQLEGLSTTWMCS